MLPLEVEDASDNVSMTTQEREKSLEEAEQQERLRLKKKYCWLSMGQFDLNDPIRRQAIYIMESKYFDRTVITLIACNSLLLGLLDYTWVDDGKKTGMPLINKIVE